MLWWCSVWKYSQELEVWVSAMSIQWVMRTFSKLLSHFCDQVWVFGASSVWGPGDSLVWQEDTNHSGLPHELMLTCPDAADCLVVYKAFGKSHKGLVLLAFWQGRRSRNLALEGTVSDSSTGLYRQCQRQWGTCWESRCYSLRARAGKCLTANSPA